MSKYAHGPYYFETGWEQQPDGRVLKSVNGMVRFPIRSVATGECGPDYMEYERVTIPLLGWIVILHRKSLSQISPQRSTGTRLVE